MHKLIQGLPYSVEVNGKSYAINTDFRIMLIIMELLEDESIPLSLKQVRATSLFYKEMPPIEYAFEPIMWFFLRGQEVEEDEEDEQPKGDPVFSFKHDADLLFAAFKAQYNVDVYEDVIHWWKFMAMFDGLTDEHQLVKVIGYRSIDLRDITDKERRKHYIEMKRLHALPGKKKPRKMSSEDIANAFM